jgi:sugar lactone lactonase YvrE
VRVTADGATVAPVTSGNHITYPGNLVLGPDGALYVTESMIPTDNGGVATFFIPGRGSIVRVDPASGSQTLVAADSLFMGPFDIAFVGPDEIWTAQGGYTSGRRGCFIRTRLSDGTSSFAIDPIDCRSRGLAVGADGTIYIADCHPIHIDCSTLFVKRLPDGPEVIGASGRMAIVPQDVVPTKRASWGSLKTIYR